MILLIACLIGSGVCARSATLCKIQNGEYKCSTAPKSLVHKVNIPSEACIIHDCGHCVKGKISYVLSESFQLVEPSRFLLKPDSHKNDSGSTFYDCKNIETRQHCECTRNGSCNGDTEICKLVHCNEDAKCFCRFTQETAKMYHVTESETLIDPMVLTFETCLYDKRVKSRRLLENEVAEFSGENITMTFIDPILRLSNLGTVIIRTQEFEHIMQVPENKEIVIPFEILSYKTTLNLIYIHSNGHTISGEIKINGKSVCQMNRCIWCVDAFRTMKCWPTYIQYLVYSFIVISTLIMIWLFKFVIKTCSWLVKTVFLMTILLVRVVKFLIRLFLLIGTFIGSKLRNTARATHEILEQGAQGGMLLVVLFVLTVAIPVNSDCSEHAILRSENEVCDHTLEGFQKCKVSSTAEITLRSIGYESCLWLRSKHNDDLLSLKIRFIGVECEFNTKRKYYTFPVQAKHVSQITCAQNFRCGWGKNCFKEDIESRKMRFEAETDGSRDFPGITTCDQSTLASGCHIIHRSACAFRRTYYVPDLENSFEVSEITGHFCRYNLAVEHTDNGTVTHMTIRETEYTPTGIRLTILGAFNQPDVHITESLVKSVSRPSEAYLVQTSDVSNPKVGSIGEVQANSSYTKEFIFDKAMTSCDWYESQIRCSTSHNALTEMVRSKEKAIPITKSLHLFRMDKGKLKSDLLISSAVRLQLQFTDYSVTVQRKTVCPKISAASITTLGCYDCGLLARISFRGQSTCEIGIAEVKFATIDIHTKVVQLDTEEAELTIRFLATKKCFQEKLCLQAGNMIQCTKIDFCLEEPSVHLKMLGMNFTNAQSSVIGGSLFNWTHFSSLNSIFYMLKFGGAALLFVGLTLTMVSTFITCCCRR